jgi:EAL domain-containing protein (putative c-di-GMP-specific phosphodiesterase class I)
MPVRNKKDEPVSCEAMLMFTDEVYPSHIIMEIAEKMGIDTAIKTWLVTKACNFCKKMRKRLPDFKVSFNATAVTYIEPDCHFGSQCD